MSIFVAELLPDGIVFASDRSPTDSVVSSTGPVLDGLKERQPNLLRWPRSKALLAYVGDSAVGKHSMYEWLYDFIGDNIEFTDPTSVAADLKAHLQLELGSSAAPTIVHFGTFARKERCLVPEVWTITNIHALESGEIDFPTSVEFVASERFMNAQMKDEAISPAMCVRKYLRERAQQFDPVWFHHGVDSRIVSTISETVQQAFKTVKGGELLEPPGALPEWEQYVRMWILTYSSYVNSFIRSSGRDVGADVISIPWPDEL
jgi:hypothetical protein